MDACTFSWLCSLKRLPQYAQEYGRSPVCTRLCIRSWVQPYGRSPVCVCLCDLSKSARPKCLPHKQHTWFLFSPLCALRCTLRVVARLSVLGRTMQCRKCPSLISLIPSASTPATRTSLSPLLESWSRSEHRDVYSS
uniref:Uncharacterized protein n=1 Tax=Gadus morhua TaxID=8049 RepID=A0A8C5CP36_GADMO